MDPPPSRVAQPTPPAAAQPIEPAPPTYRTCAKRHAPDTITLDSSLVTAGHNTVEFADQHPIDDAGQLTTATLTCVVVSPTATDNDA